MLSLSPSLSVFILKHGFNLSMKLKHTTKYTSIIIPHNSSAHKIVRLICIVTAYQLITHFIMTANQLKPQGKY